MSRFLVHLLWFAVFLAATSLAVRSDAADTERSAGLSRLLESPLTGRSFAAWQPTNPGFSWESSDAQRRWSRRDSAWRLPSGYADSPYRFGQRLPGDYSGPDYRFGSNSYGGPWYYPGSPANTRSSWRQWNSSDW